MTERNPNHPVVGEIRESWYKIAALIMAKCGKKELTITCEDVDAFAASGLTNIVVNAKNDRLVIQLVDEETGQKLAEKEGGLPI